MTSYHNPVQRYLSNISCAEEYVRELTMKTFSASGGVPVIALRGNVRTTLFLWALVPGGGWVWCMVATNKRGLKLEDVDVQV